MTEQISVYLRQHVSIRVVMCGNANLSSGHGKFVEKSRKVGRKVKESCSESQGKLVGKSRKVDRKVKES